MSDLHQMIENELRVSRQTLGHSVDKGDASELVWLELLRRYLPKRYKAMKATVVDSEGAFSRQIDIVICDRQYTPFVFTFKETLVVPAESVYAVFECKQEISSENVEYAKNAARSVRVLHRTSLPIPHAGGTYPAKPPGRILSGLLAFESSWTPPMGQTFVEHLVDDDPLRELDLGCVAVHGTFSRNADGSYQLVHESKPATAFLLELIARLQELATVPMIDVRAYARWLSPDIESESVGIPVEDK